MHFEEKETVKPMSKGGYIRKFFEKWQVVVDIFWLVVGGGGYIFAVGEWWWIYFEWWWWMVVGRVGWWHSLA